MSASREKKKRLDQVEPETGSTQQGKKGLGKTAKTIIGIVIAIALIAVVVFFGMVNTGYFEKHTTAATVSGHKVSPAMLNFYYTNTYQQNQQTLSMLTDPEKPLDEQEYISDDYETWGDYLMDAAVGNANATYAVYDEALAQGFVLPEDIQTAIDQELENLDAIATMNGFGNGDALLAANYGKGCNTKVYQEFITTNYTAQAYMDSVIEGMDYTQEELDAYYAEHADQFDSIDYRIFPVMAKTEEPEEEGAEPVVTEEALAAAEEAAKAAVEASKDEAAFLEQAAAHVEAEDYDAAAATLVEDRPLKTLDEATKTWAAEEGRKAGDVTYVPNGSENGFNVVYYIGATDHSYLLPTVRHILAAFPEEADDAAKEETKARAQAILDEYNAGEKTEDAFAALATEKSEDPGTAANGGLYDNIVKNTTVEAFDAWCFDAARKPGDVELVETEYGYHIIYFVGLGQSFQNYAVEQTKLNEDFTAWHEGLVNPDDYEIVSTKYVATR